MPISDPRLIGLLESLESTLGELGHRLACDGPAPTEGSSSEALESVAEEALRSRDA